MALLLPLLALILVGIVDLGRAYFGYITITNAAREGVRYAAKNPLDDTGAKTAAVAEASGSGFTITSNDVSLPTGHSIQPGDPISVTVSVNFPLLSTYIFGGGSIRLSNSATMVILQGVGD